MKNEARSHSHRWVVEPDRFVQSGKTLDRIPGNVVRQRLTVVVKSGWRLATWDEINPADPQTAEAFDYKREQEAKEPPARVDRVVVYRGGVPDARPVHVEPVAPDLTAATIAALTDFDLTDDGGNI